jgi:hypothetical protein
MVEVIHEHDTHRDSGNGLSVMVGVLMAIALIFFLFYYFGRGFIGGTGSNQPQINIPDKVNVDVNQK